MSKFDLIDDFLSDRMGDQEKADFEQQAAADPSLKADLDMQRHIVNGVKNARRLELKAFLNNIPVGGSTFGGSGITGIKVAASVVTAALIGSVVYFTVLRNAQPAPDLIGSKKITEKGPAKSEQKSDVSTEPLPSVAPVPETASPVKSETKSGLKKSPTEVVAPDRVQQPKIDVVDPSEEMVSSTGTETNTRATTGRATAPSRIVVDTDASNKTYAFHYQFSGTRLMLFGPFDKSLYEIIEINGDQKSVFLFYKGDYYLLSDKQNTVTPLLPIKDPVLIKKLKEYRGQ